MQLSRNDIRQLVGGVKPTIVDRVVERFSPQRGVARRRARVTLALLGSGSAYTGARRNRRQTSSWPTTSGSADADLIQDLPLLRERSRDLVRNTPLASGAINTAVTSVVGTGLRLQAQIDREILRISPEQAAVWQTRTEREFRLWAGSVDCDATRRQTFAGLQDLAFRSSLENGDVFALLPYSDGRGPYRLVVQLIEGDRVSSPLGFEGRLLDGGGRVIAGIEMDALGAPVACHVLQTHPGETRAQAKKWDRVPVYGAESRRRNVIHLYRQLRVGQSRGVPYLAPVIEAFKQLGDYSEAELTAAVVSSLFTVFVTSDAGEGIDPTLGIGDETGAKASDKDVRLGSGAMVDLAPGEKTEFANPTRPNTSFDGFVMAVLRQIGTALEIPFEVLIKHFTASYSASRAALLEAWRHFRIRRRWLADGFCQPVYEAWLEDAIGLGRVSAPGFFDDAAVRAAWLGARWGGDGPGQLDPKKEIEATQARLDANLTTLAQEKADYDGGDWEATLEQAGRERDMRRRFGLLDVAPVRGAGAVVNPAPPDDGGDDSGDIEEGD